MGGRANRPGGSCGTFTEGTLLGVLLVANIQ